MNSFGAKYKRLIVWRGLANLLSSEVISSADKLIDFLVYETFKPLISFILNYLQNRECASQHSSQLLI